MDDFLADDSLEKLEDSLEVKSGIFENTWAVGQKIESLFVIERIVGRGNFGRVYQAKDSRGRVCAVKTIDLRPAAHPEAAKRLQNSFTRLLSAKNPNLVQTQEAGEAGGFYYIKTPFIKAPSLLSGLNRSIPQAKEAGGIPPRQSLRIIKAATQACKAVGWEIPHLNLLPGNMFVTGNGIVVADSGILHALLPAMSPGEFSAMDLSEYRAPEVRDCLEPDASADVYSVAKLIYHLVSLERPPLVLEDVPIVGDYPDGVRDLLLYAAQENPENRYANLQQFADAFEKVLKGDRVRAPVHQTSSVLDKIPEEEVFSTERSDVPTLDEDLPEDILSSAEEMAAMWRKSESPRLRAESGYIESDTGPAAGESVSDEAEEEEPEEVEAAASAEPEETATPAGDAAIAASRPRPFDEGKAAEETAEEKEITEKPPAKAAAKAEVEEILAPPTFETGLSTAKVTAISVIVLAIIFGGLYILSDHLKQRESRTSVMDKYRSEENAAENSGAAALSGNAAFKDTLTTEDIATVVKKYRETTDACFTMASKTSGPSQGAVLVSFSIQPAGSVSDAVVLTSTLNDLVVEQCLRKAVLTMQFPAFKRSAMTVSYPFKYKK